MLLCHAAEQPERDAVHSPRLTLSPRGATVISPPKTALVFETAATARRLHHRFKKKKNLPAHCTLMTDQTSADFWGFCLNGGGAFPPRPSVLNRTGELDAGEFLQTPPNLSHRLHLLCSCVFPPLSFTSRAGSANWGGSSASWRCSLKCCGLRINGKRSDPRRRRCLFTCLSAPGS